MARWQDLTDEQLIALPTNRLYTVYKLLQKNKGYSRYRDDIGRDDNRLDEIERKCTFIKSELDTRGHIEREKIAPNHGQSVREPVGGYWWIEKEAPVPEGPIKEPTTCIGKQVFKRSKKPFKSKQFYNTVKAVTTNPHTKLVAFSFEEDGSVVDVHQCNLRENKK